jgi:hypothetical protein
MLKNNFGSVILLLLGLIVGCSPGEQTDEANILVNEAKYFSDKAAVSDTEFNSLMNRILSSNLQNTENPHDYIKDNKSKFNELIILGQQLEENRGELISKLEKASKLNLNDKFKEYLELKIRENRKLAEVDKLKTNVAEEFFKAKNTAEYLKSASRYNRQKFDDIEKEAVEFSNKAEQITKDNPSVFEKK